MEYTNYQSVPVYSSDRQPLMPCHPARARKLLRKGRAKPHHVRGIFGIRLLDRTHAESAVQDVALHIDTGSDTSGFAIISDGQTGQRKVLAAVELKHRAKAIKATMTLRRQHRRARRSRLRYRAPRFNNRRRASGTLPPSVDSLRLDTMRVVHTLQKMYPISRISIERYQFDPQPLAPCTAGQYVALPAPTRGRASIVRPGHASLHSIHRNRRDQRPLAVLHAVSVSNIVLKQRHHAALAVAYSRCISAGRTRRTQQFQPVDDWFLLHPSSAADSSTVD